MFGRKTITKLIVPLIVEQFLAVLIGMADTVMVSSCGEAAVSGVSLVDSINLLLINVFAALATGGAIVVSQYIGRDDSKNASAAARQLVASVTLLSLGVMALCLALNKLLLSLIFGHVEPDVMSNAEIYFFITALSYPFIALSNAGSALFRATNNSKISMATSALMNVINVIGNAILIYGFKMGVAGAAIPTLVSRIVAAVLILWLLKRSHHKIYIGHYLKIRLQPKLVRTIMRIGIPNGLENGMFQLGKIMVQGLIASFGTASIAANAVAVNVSNISLIPSTAIGLGMITVVGQCVGAKNYKEAKRQTLRLTGLSILCIFVLCLFTILLLNPIISIFNLQPDTFQIAYDLIFYHSIASILIWAPAFTLPNALRAAGDVKFTMIVSVVSMWVCRIGLSYLITSLFPLGALGVWIAMTVDWLVRTIFFVVRYLRGKWLTKSVIDSPEPEGPPPLAPDPS